MDKIKILGMSDSPKIATGYANQSRELFKRLALNPDFEAMFLGWQTRTFPPILDGYYYDYDKKQFSSQYFEGGLKMLEDLSSGQPNDFGTFTLPQYLKREQPDLLWILGDSFFFNPPYSNFCNIDLAPAKSILYFPSDGRPLPDNCVPIFNKVNTLVAMSKYAQQQAITGAFPLERSYDCLYIPHGVNSSSFYPLNSQERADNRLRWGQRLSQINGRHIDLSDKFILGSVTRNQPRKMLMDQLTIFKEFAKDKPDAVMLMHTDPLDHQGTNLLDAVNRVLKIQDKVIWTGMNLAEKQFNLQDLNQIYNLMDCHILSTSGEGFGIPTVEAQMAGVPSVLTNYTTTNELVIEPQCGLGVDVAQELVGQCFVNRAIVSKSDFVQKLNLIHTDRNLLAKFAANCRNNAVSKYDFDKIVFPAWLKLFKEMMD